MSGNVEKYINAQYRVTQQLLPRAWRLGIEVPNSADWWADDDDINMEAGGIGVAQLELIRRRYLTEEGKARLIFLIEDAENKKADAKLDRRLKHLGFYAQIFTILFGLTGWIAGLYALLRH